MFTCLIQILLHELITKMVVNDGDVVY